eukprot:2644321-Rhodomonas_salina.4
MLLQLRDLCYDVSRDSADAALLMPGPFMDCPSMSSTLAAHSLLLDPCLDRDSAGHLLLYSLLLPLWSPVSSLLSTPPHWVEPLQALSFSLPCLCGASASFLSLSFQVLTPQPHLSPPPSALPLQSLCILLLPFLLHLSGASAHPLTPPRQGCHADVPPLIQLGNLQPSPLPAVLLPAMLPCQSLSIPVMSPGSVHSCSPSSLGLQEAIPRGDGTLGSSTGRGPGPDSWVLPTRTALAVPYFCFRTAVIRVVGQGQ